MALYWQSTGQFSFALNGEDVTAIGWSGNHEGKNNPDMQNVHCVGPIPAGEWMIEDWEDEHPGKGPIVAHLFPCEGTETFRRSGFLIHGASLNPEHHGQESEGCIILDHSIRQNLRDSGETHLTVIA